MKVLHLLAQLPAHTGSGVYYTNIIHYLKKYGYEQRALFAVQDGYRFPDLPPEAQCPIAFRTPTLPFPIVGMSDVMPYESTRYSDMDAAMHTAWCAAFTEALVQLKRDFCPDVVIMHHLWFLTAIAIDVFGDAAKKVALCHNTDLRQAKQHPSLQKAYVTNLNQLDLVFSLEDAQKAEIAATFSIDTAKIATLGGGFNTEIFYPAPKPIPPTPIRLVFAGKIDASKGIYELLHAFRALSAQKSNLRLDIIGQPDSENSAALHALIDDMPNIALLPVTTQPILAERLRSAHIFVMPSFYEGLGLIAIEALACGLYTVSTATSGLHALLGDAVNQSGVIEYVPAPQLYDTDKPRPEALADFSAALTARLLVQIEKIEQRTPFPPEMLAEIQTLSWDALIARLNEEILSLH